MLKELVSESENDNGVLGELQQPPLTSTGSNESEPWKLRQNQQD